MSLKQRKELNIQIGNRIREARIAAHYTQAQLAKKLDVSIPSLPLFIDICNILRVTPNELLADSLTAYHEGAGKQLGLEPSNYSQEISQFFPYFLIRIFQIVNILG